MKNDVASRWHPANLLTGFRLVAAPPLLLLAWFGRPLAFLALLALCFLTDLLDGYVARRTGITSTFGAKLDSWSDGVIYATIAVSGWWLWPDVIRREAVFVALVVASFSLPTVVGFAKFNTLPSYHTWSVKLAVASTGTAIYPLFLFDIAWPFHWAAVICVAAAAEEIAITCLLKEPRSNVVSVAAVIRRDCDNR